MRTRPAPTVNSHAMAARLADLATEVLAFPVEETTDLPAAGLDLPVAARLAARAHEDLGLPLTVSDLYLGRSPRAIVAGTRSDTLPADPCPTAGPALVSGFRRIWRDEAAHPGHPAAVVSLAYLGTGDCGVDPERLAGAVHAVVERQEALRTVFVDADGPPTAVPLPYDGRPPVTTVALPDAGWEALRQALDLASAGALEGFDTTRGPLLRCVLYTWSGGRLLVVHLHRSALDPWSLDTFERELEVMYATAGRPAGAAARHAATSRWRPAGFDPDDCAERWRERLDGARALRWPAAAGEPWDDRGAVEHHVELDAALMVSLDARTRAEGVSLTTLVCTAGAMALAEVTGARDICLGLSVPGRVEAWQDTALGHHVATVPVRVRVEPGQRPAELVHRVDEEVLFAVDHRWTDTIEFRGRGTEDRTGLPGQVTVCVHPQHPAGTLRLGEAVLAPARLPRAEAPAELAVELLRSTRPDGRRNLLLTSAPSRLGAAALARLATSLHAALTALAHGGPNEG
ncbi:condensation domain-containing protein [Actinacidiphila glaucinigra]|uniref:condensation domain-containing protein n=1 Tax=Actinacidiphila glaucinigra TaxID=235986 RepID=UPI0029A6B1DB|nr:condensation domain-containing protein [Streptomyces sp. PA03-3a]